MKITIAVLVVLLIGVSGWAVYDHLSLSKKIDSQSLTITKFQAANSKQAGIIKNILACSNATESTYNKTSKYVSVSACIKSKLSI